MNIRPIRTDADYHAALSRIDELWGAEIGTADGDELDVAKPQSARAQQRGGEEECENKKRE